MGSYHLQDPFRWICDSYWAWNFLQIRFHLEMVDLTSPKLLYIKLKYICFLMYLVSYFLILSRHPSDRVPLRTLITKSDREISSALRSHLFVELKAPYFARTIFNVAQRTYVTHAKEGGGTCRVEGTGASWSFIIKWYVLFSLVHLCPSIYFLPLIQGWVAGAAA